jgi:lipoate-protein ligase A
MGLDEALLESRDAPPTLRMYTWSPDTLSLGYFQKLAEVPAAAAGPGAPRVGAPGVGAVVRRITGGGAIHHAGELTFSITASLDHPLYRGPVADSYRRVHAAVAASLRALGVEAGERGESALASDRAGTGLCFHHSTPLDLAWEGRKGVGSAQRRAQGRVLHHGSIKLTGSAVEQGVATVAGSGAGRPGPELDAPAYAPLLRAALEETFGLRLEADVPSEDERRRARVLATRYLDPAFVARR